MGNTETLGDINHLFLDNIMNGVNNLKFHRRFIIISIIINISIILFGFLKYDVYRVAYIRSFGLSLMVGFAMYIVYFLYLLFIGTMIVFTITKIKHKILLAYIPLIVTIATILVTTFLPYSNIYLKAYYAINKECLERTVVMLDNGEMDKYQIDSGTYTAPYRTTSYTSMIYANSKTKESLFFVYRGLTTGVVVLYSEDGASYFESDRSKQYENIRIIEDNWYSATVTY